MRNAFTAIFAREIRERRIDVFDLGVLKGMTVDFRRKAARYGREQIAVTMAKFPDLDEAKARWFLLFQAVQQPVVIGPHGEKWIVHPVPDTAEPGKAVHLVTDFGDYEPVRLARLVDRVSLHRLDNFFQQIRRKLNLLERPIATSSSMWKVWRGYSPYNPAIIPKLLDIYRVYHNYVKLEEPRTDATGARLPRRTPAMRLGLARGPSIVGWSSPVAHASARRGDFFHFLLLAVGLDDLRPAHSFGLCLPSDHPDHRLVEVYMLQLLRPRANPLRWREDGTSRMPDNQCS